MRYGQMYRAGPLPRLWRRLHYHIPDIFYEAIVAKLVRNAATWLDVGSGRHLFPGNSSLAKSLAESAQLLVGVDPDDAVNHNPFLHRRFQGGIEDFVSDTPFEVVTLRMVAEHITRPDVALQALARLTAPGSKVVVFTVNRWSPVALAAWLVPFQLHYPVKRALWHVADGTGTFPVAYAMNTRDCLRRQFAAHGFSEVLFAYLDDCRTFFRFDYVHFVELMLWRTLRNLGINYPENCLLGVYEKC